MRDLRELDNDQVFADPRTLAALQATALEKLKKFEFNLRKKADGDDQPLSLSGSEEVPAGFRDAIEGVLPLARAQAPVEVTSTFQIQTRDRRSS